MTCLWSKHLIKRSELENNWLAAVEVIFVCSSPCLSTHKHSATPGRHAHFLIYRHLNVPSPLKEADDMVFLIAVTRSSECFSPRLPDNNNILTDLSWVQVKFNATQGTAKQFPFFFSPFQHVLKWEKTP